MIISNILQNVTRFSHLQSLALSSALIVAGGAPSPPFTPAARHHGSHAIRVSHAVGLSNKVAISHAIHDVTMSHYIDAVRLSHA